MRTFFAVPRKFHLSYAKTSKIKESHCVKHLPTLQFTDLTNIYKQIILLNDSIFFGFNLFYLLQFVCLKNDLIAGECLKNSGAACAGGREGGGSIIR